MIAARKVVALRVKAKKPEPVIVNPNISLPPPVAVSNNVVI